MIVFDNLKGGNNPQNSDFDDLPFDYDQMFITSWPIDSIIMILYKFWTIFSSIVDVYMKQM